MNWMGGRFRPRKVFLSILQINLYNSLLHDGLKRRVGERPISSIIVISEKDLLCSETVCLNFSCWGVGKGCFFGVMAVVPSQRHQIGNNEKQCWHK